MPAKNEQKIPYKIYLTEEEMPKAWYNMRSDMKVKPAPLLNPGTGAPMTAEELSGVFCEELVQQELDEDTVMMDALDSGAEDCPADGPVFEITTDPDAFNDVVAALEKKGYTFESAELEMVPQNYVTMTGEDDVKSMEKLLDMLDDNEDVQNVWHNWQQD